MDFTAVEIFEEFLGYPETSGGIPRRDGPPGERALAHGAVDAADASATFTAAFTAAVAAVLACVESHHCFWGTSRILQNSRSAVKSNSFPTILGPSVLAPRVLDNWRDIPQKFVPEYSS